MENKNQLLSQTFMWLFIGLLVCFGVSYFTTLSDEAIQTVYGSFNGLGYIIFIILELVVAIALSWGIRKLSPTLAKIFYLVYTALTGLTLSGIFIVYTGSSIALVFLITSILFGIFALIGKYTKLDLSKLGIYLFIGLIAIIIIEIINLFILSNSLNMILIIATIVVFLGYVAYDIHMLLKSDFLDDSENKPIYFAFQLFLDFINIFIELLKIFGKNRD